MREIEGQDMRGLHWQMGGDRGFVMAFCPFLLFDVKVGKSHRAVCTVQECWWAETVQPQGRKR